MYVDSILNVIAYGWIKLIEANYSLLHLLVWSVLYFGIQRRVTRWQSADISDEQIVSIFRTEEYTR
jgi:hypothetical protein